MSWALDFRLDGKHRRVVLASVSRMTLKAGRDRADDLTVNPRKGEPPFGEAWRTMIDEVDKPAIAKGAPTFGLHSGRCVSARKIDAVSGVIGVEN